jgi:uncharacterized protein YndB with AHSA1/START domain
MAVMIRTLLVPALLVLTTLSASADVIERSPSGFTLQSVVTVAASPDRAFKALVDVASWWDREHTYSGDAKNLSISAQPGGCFCERLAGGGGVEHARVVNVAPGTLLRLDGALGPLQQLAVTGSLTWQLSANGNDSTTITMTYAVGGYAAAMEKLAPLVDQVMSRQVDLLEAYLEGR